MFVHWIRWHYDKRIINHNDSQAFIFSYNMICLVFVHSSIVLCVYSAQLVLCVYRYFDLKIEFPIIIIIIVIIEIIRLRFKSSCKNIHTQCNWSYLMLVSIMSQSKMFIAAGAAATAAAAAAVERTCEIFTFNIHD